MPDASIAFPARISLNSCAAAAREMSSHVSRVSTWTHRPNVVAPSWPNLKQVEEERSNRSNVSEARRFCTRALEKAFVRDLEKLLYVSDGMFAADAIAARRSSKRLAPSRAISNRKLFAAMRK